MQEVIDFGEPENLPLAPREPVLMVFTQMKLHTVDNLSTIHPCLTIARSSFSVFSGLRP